MNLAHNPDGHERFVTWINALGSGNPSRGNVTLQYLVHVDGDASIAIYDARGRYVTTLVDARLGAGRYLTTWDGRDRAGVAMPSGVYVAQLRAGGAVATTRIVRLR